jgi:hypothetical protein
MKVVTKERTNKVTLQNETEIFVEIKETLYFWGVTNRTDKALIMIAEANKWIETAERLERGEIKNV